MFFSRPHPEREALRTLAKAAGASAAPVASRAGNAYVVKFTPPPPPPDSSCRKPDLAEPCAHLLREVTA